MDPKANDLTASDVGALIESESQNMLGTNAAEAIQMLHRGELSGTVAGEELQMLVSLLPED